MRLNRNTRIGLVCIGIALIGFLFLRLLSALSAPPANVAAANTADAAPVQAVALPTGRFEAKVAIPDHTLITTSMLKPAPAISGSDASQYVTDISQVVGSVTARTISKGESLKVTDLLGHITQGGVSLLLRPGMRAQVVPIPNKAILHDLVAIGDYIDVIGAFDGQEARTIVQNVRVLAVDVFGGDFAPTKAAQRGDYKAEVAGSPAPPPPAGGPPGPGATPTPTPAPEGPPPAKPDPAITIEVTQDQAAAIALAQNSQAALDFLLRPRPAVATVGPVRMVSINKAKLAPYADRMKKSPSGAKPVAAAAAPAQRQSRPIPMRDYVQPPMPDGGGTVTPAQIPMVPDTYQIPVYGDGKITRMDTVRKP